MILLLSSWLQPVLAQDNIIDQTNSLWYFLGGNHEITEKFGINTELHMRLAEWGTQKQQLLIRPSVYYKVTDNLKMQVGYTYIQNYPYGNQPLPERIPENNFWLQAEVYNMVKNVSITHRYRYEMRSVGLPDLSSSEFEHKFFQRFRYRLTIKVPFGESKKMYAVIFDEVWLNLGSNVNNYIFNQNWLHTGLGRKISKSLAIELAYQWMVLDKPDGIHRESNNIIQTSIKYKIPFNKKNQ